MKRTFNPIKLFVGVTLLGAGVLALSLGIPEGGCGGDELAGGVGALQKAVTAEITPPSPCVASSEDLDDCTQCCILECELEKGDDTSPPLDCINDCAIAFPGPVEPEIDPEVDPICHCVVGNDSYEDCVDCCGACNPDGGGTLDGCLLECSQLPSDCTPESEGFNACCACLDCCEEQNGDVPGAAGQCKNGCADLLPGDGRFISCAGLCEAHCAATSTSCADCRSCCSATDPADRPGQSSCDTMCQNQFPGPGCASIGPPTADQEACAALAAAIAKCIPIPFANGLSCDPPSGNAGGADWVACRLACFTAQQCLSKRLRGHTVPPACRGMLTGYGGGMASLLRLFFRRPAATLKKFG